jgi:putative flippase GtrA
MTAAHAARIISARRGTLRQAISFGAIGVVSTLAYVALYAWLRPGFSAAAANLIALVATAIGNTAANRRLTFAVKSRRGVLRDQAAGFVALAIALAITSGSLAVLQVVAPGHSRRLEVAVLVAANAAATVARFFVLRVAILRPDREPRATARVTVEPGLRQTSR